MKRFDLEVPVREQIYSLFQSWKSKGARRMCFCILLLDLKFCWLIYLTFECCLSVQLQACPVYRTKQLSPTVIRSSLNWMIGQTGLMICTAEGKVSSYPVLSGMKISDGKDWFFLTPGSSFFSWPDPTPRGIFLNFVMNCLTSQCICETTMRGNTGKATGKEMDDFTREHFVITFQIGSQHMGPMIWVSWHACLVWTPETSQESLEKLCQLSQLCTLGIFCKWTGGCIGDEEKVQGKGADRS